MTQDKNQVTDGRNWNFSMVDNEVLEYFELNPFTGWAYIHLIRRGGKDRKSGISLARLASDTKMSKPKLLQCLEELEAKKLILRNRTVGGDKNVNHYFIVNIQRVKTYVLEYKQLPPLDALQVMNIAGIPMMVIAPHKPPTPQTVSHIDNDAETVSHIYSDTPQTVNGVYSDTPQTVSHIDRKYMGLAVDDKQNISLSAPANAGTDSAGTAACMVTGQREPIAMTQATPDVSGDVNTDDERPVKKERAAKPNPMYDAIADVLGVHGAQNGLYAGVLAGKAKRKGYAEHNTPELSDEPVTPEELRAWAADYRRKNPGLSIITQPGKLVSALIEYRKQRPAHSTTADGAQVYGFTSATHARSFARALIGRGASIEQVAARLGASADDVRTLLEGDGAR